MIKLKLFFMYNLVRIMQYVAENMYLNIRVKLEKRGDKSINNNTIHMYKRYFKVKCIEMRLKDKYLKTAMNL